VKEKKIRIRGTFLGTVRISHFRGKEKKGVKQDYVVTTVMIGKQREKEEKKL